MASAVFAAENEAHMAKFTCRPNSNPHFSEQLIHNPSRDFKRHDTTSNKHFNRNFNSPSPFSTPPAWPQPMDHESARFSNPRPNTLVDGANLFHKEYVTFNLASYSRIQVCELKKRLISDLIRVQCILKFIQIRELQCRGFLPPDFQRREALELPHPQVNQNGAFNNLPENQTPNVRAFNNLPENQAPNVRAFNNLPENQAPNVRAFNNLPENQAPNVQSTELGDQRNKRTGNKLSGKKRTHTLTLDGDCKQPAVKGGSRIDKALNSMMRRRCKQILEKLMKRKNGWIFNKPVDTKQLGLHDYSLIIKNPMDLGTVKLRLDKNEYKTPQEFAADVRLTFNNAMVYNPKGERVHVMAELFLQSFEDMFKTAYQKSEAEENNKAFAPQQMTCDPTEQIVERGESEQILIAKKSKTGSSLAMVLNPPVPIQASVPTALKSCPPPGRSGKLPKPKVNNPNKMQMTFEEKAKLGLSLQNLPQEKMERMLQILMKRNSSLPEEGGEIELDIDALDNETLWELHMFVGSQKNVKMQRISEDVHGENEPIPKHVVQKINKGDAGREDVDIGEDIPNTDMPPVMIEKDASGTSSSSSSSDSSSSGNSSGSDSEDSVQSPYIETKKPLNCEP